MIALDVLGVNGALSEGKNTSLVVWENPQNGLLLDCGSTVFQDVLQKRMVEHINTVFISHRHQDHIGSLETLLEYRWLVLQKKTAVLGAITSDILTDLLGDEWPLYAELLTDMPQYTLIPTTHSPRMPSTGLFTHGVLYSGDTNASLLNTPSAQKAHVIFHDTALQTNPSHCSLAALAEAPLEIRQKTYLIHYRATDYETLRRKANELDFAGVATTDMHLTIPQSAY